MTPTASATATASDSASTLASLSDFAATFDTPADVAPELEVWDKALRQLRASVAGTDFSDKITVEHGEGRTVLANLKLYGEGQWARQEFFSRQQDSCVPAQGPKSHPRTQGSRWVRFATEDRLGFGEHVERMLKSLAGLPLRVSQESSWRWDNQHRRLKGQSTYVPTYGLFWTKGIDVQGALVAFNPGPLIEKFRQSHCMSRDARADAHLLNYCVDRGVDVPFGYSWTRTGFCASVKTKEDAERLMREGFGDCTFAIERIGSAKEKLGWKVTVDFPG